MGAALLLVIAAAVAAAAIAVRRNERARREVRAATVDLGCDALGVRRLLADGREEAVDWADLVEVEVLTTAVGVHREDGVVLVLTGTEGRGCLVPSGLAVEHGVIERLHAQPGFDGRRLVEAMQRRPPSRTTVWQRRQG